MAILRKSMTWNPSSLALLLPAWRFIPLAHSSLLLSLKSLFRSLLSTLSFHKSHCSSFTTATTCSPDGIRWVSSLFPLFSSILLRLLWQESTIEFSMNSPTLKSSFPNLSYLYINAFWDVLGHPFYGETIEEIKDEFDSSIDRYNPTWSFEIEGFVKAVKANSWKMSYMQ